MIKTSAYILSLIILLFFGFNNSQDVQLLIFPGSFEINSKLYLIIFLFFLLGSLSSYLLYSIKIVRLKLTNRSLKKKIVFLEKQIGTTNDAKQNNLISHNAKD